MRKPALFILAGLACASACPAAIEWKITELQLAAQPGQQSMSIRFPFRNAGSGTVRILSLDPSCSCMSARPDKAVIGPGEAAEIIVDLSLAGYSGRVRRSVVVRTDEPADRYTDLTMTVDIPELVAINPRFLFWRMGDPPDDREAEIVLADPATTSIAGIECANHRFHARISPRQPGAFRLSIRPDDTRAADEAMFHLNFTVGGRSVTYVVYAAVK